MANGRLERQEKAIDGALVGVPKRRLERLEGGFGVFACGVGGAKKAFGGFGGFEAWQTARLIAKKKLLMGPWCLCLRGWGRQKGIWRVWRVWRV